MAFVIEEKKKATDWSTILIGTLFLGIIGGVIYYLFFTATPAIETIVSSKDFEKTSELSKINIDVVNVINDPVFKSLRKRVQPATVGDLGRENPFAPF